MRIERYVRADGGVVEVRTREPGDRVIRETAVAGGRDARVAAILAERAAMLIDHARIDLALIDMEDTIDG